MMQQQGSSADLAQLQSIMQAISLALPSSRSGNYPVAKSVASAIQRTPVHSWYIFCCWARDAAVGVTKSITEPDTEPVVTVYTAALCLMFQILNWDFRYNTSGKKVV
ncbi:hypothetical protein GH714_001307 [Hevea brasiliensis]|uniref:Uncharacterized protein n=1 Tax=Hevea brasiliensis TaxID=3981 RepID=A0A6A6KJG8_HEVBR|nr:hypothetical protein GH714_001307 [Hevea brasiliensis]